MGIRELETFYESSLRPVFGAQLRIIHERNDFVHIILDGEKEDFFFTLYGIGCVRLYWCNECFIFDQQRNNLVSSDTFGEIVFEGKIDVQKLPQTIVDLVLQLRISSFISKKERVKGKIPSGYDNIKDYIIQAKTDNPQKNSYEFANILMKLCSEVHTVFQQYKDLLDKSICYGLPAFCSCRRTARENDTGENPDVCHRLIPWFVRICTGSRGRNIFPFIQEINP